MPSAIYLEINVTFLLFAPWEIFYCRLLIFFKINCFKKFFQEYNLSVSNRLDSDQARQNCRLLIFFQNKLFQKIISGIPSECQTDWIQTRPDKMHDIPETTHDQMHLL